MAEGYGKVQIRAAALRALALCLCAVLLALLGLPLQAPRAAADAPARITVSAAASLKDAFTEIGDAFKRARPDVDIALNFGASGALELQIEQGAPVDVFISASSDEMDKLAAKGLLSANTRVDLLRNELVLIAPRDSKVVTGFGDLQRADVATVAMGDPRTVPAGAYAQQVLTSLGMYDSVKRKVVLATDVRQVLLDIETGSAEAGFVYATDAAISNRVRVVADAPPGSHQPVIYPGAVLRDSQHADAARSFLAFLQGPAARAAFAKQGFRPAEK
jgi:molybdate transport system substrate-binding protein